MCWDGVLLHCYCRRRGKIYESLSSSLPTLRRTSLSSVRFKWSTGTYSPVTCIVLVYLTYIVPQFSFLTPPTSFRLTWGPWVAPSRVSESWVPCNRRIWHAKESGEGLTSPGAYGLTTVCYPLKFYNISGMNTVDEMCPLERINPTHRD